MSSINTQFSVGVHIATMLGHYAGSKVVSSDLARSVNADASFVRAVLAKLSRAGIVVTARGRNGHSALARPASQISLLDIYRATEAPPPFAIHDYPVHKHCPVSHAHRRSMGRVLAEAQSKLERALARKPLSDLVKEVRAR
jgi:Rrf2 family protein